ncbi:eae-like domain protein [Escherichia coli]|uniref:eae-like domain protein n=1 Tax=Escherichia coli TaxID=562 RepID=UPI0023629A20|nr:eae-like domain protein [Escherichia coli]MDD0835703.1 eae-like domain protein [Escherichia coli]
MESNIKGLVAAGHEMASELKAECGAVDMRSVAKLISYLATQLEVQLVRANALAAENALARKAVQAFCDVVGDSTEVICEEIGRDGVLVILEAMKATGNMPATDAFLSEVRASELDSLAGLAETMLVKFSNQQCSSDMHEVVGWKMVLQQANNRASQLRKGGNQ